MASVMPFLINEPAAPDPGINAVTPAAAYSPMVDVGSKMSNPVLSIITFSIISPAYCVAIPTATAVIQTSPLESDLTTGLSSQYANRFFPFVVVSALRTSVLSAPMNLPNSGL